MDIREQVKEVIINRGGIAKSADFVVAGIRAVDISASDATVKTLVIPTNEALMIALDTQKLVNA